MVQAERRPAGHPAGRRERAAAHRPRPPPVRPPRLRSLRLRRVTELLCSPRLNFSSLRFHQHHVTSAHAIGCELYPHLHIHEEGGGLRREVPEEPCAHAHLSARPAPLRGSPPFAPGAAPPGPARRRGEPPGSDSAPRGPLSAPARSLTPHVAPPGRAAAAAPHLPAAAYPGCLSRRGARSGAMGLITCDITAVLPAAGGFT